MAQFFGTVLLGWVVGVTAANDALLTAILVTATIATLMAAGGLFAQKSRYAITVETTFVVAMVVIMILVHAVL